MRDLENSITTLKNGTRIANFSSPHIYTFDDGTKMDKCDMREAGLFKVQFRERVVKDNKRYCWNRNGFYVVKSTFIKNKYVGAVI